MKTNTPTRCRWKPLKIWKDVLAVVGDRHRLASPAPTLSNFLMIFQVLVSHDHDGAVARLGRSTETNILVAVRSRSTRWNGEGYSPFHSGSFTYAIFFQRRGSASDVSKTAMLFCAEVVHHREVRCRRARSRPRGPG